MRRRALLLSSLTALPIHRTHAQGTAGAAAWPTRPVRLVVPFPPGGSADALARRLAERMTGTLGQPVLVENRPGAGGTIGADFVAKASPDGQTLGISSLAAHAVGPAVYASVAYHPVRDFTHIALLGEFPLTLAVSGNGPYHDLAALLTAAREKPGMVRVGTPGNGTASQVSLEMLRRLTGVELAHVPFRSGGTAAIDTIAGRIEATMAGLGELGGNERLRLVGLAAPERLAGWPQAPTFREQGTDFVATVWFGLCAPAGLPGGIADRLHGEAQAMLAQPETAALVARLGSTPDRRLPRAEVAAFITAEAARWGEVARAGGVRAE